MALWLLCRTELFAPLNTLGGTLLSSDRAFGFFFSLLFFIASGLVHRSQGDLFAIVLLALGAIFFCISIVSPSRLGALKRLWLKLGKGLNIVMQPLLLSTIFFLIITPLAVLLRIGGRDELCLARIKGMSNWSTPPDSSSNDLRKQY